MEQLNQGDTVYLLFKYGTRISKCTVKAVMDDSVVLTNQEGKSEIFYIKDPYLETSIDQFYYKKDLEELKPLVIDSIKDLLRYYKEQLINYQREAMNYEKILDKVNAGEFESRMTKSFT